MHTTAMPADQVDPVHLIPPPNELRLLIARRHAEITVLRRLLKAAESKSRLLMDKAEVANVGTR